MAQLGARALLLWAGVIALSSCQSAIKPTPAGQTTKTATIPAPTTVIGIAQSNMTPTQSPPTADQRNNISESTTALTTPTTTPTTTIKQTTEDPDKDKPCSFLVQSAPYGLSINTGVNGSFNVAISAPNQGPNNRMITGPSEDIPGLKPCTNYTVEVQRRGGMTCTSNNNSTFTRNMTKGDVSYAPHSAGLISFTSKWDIDCSNVSHPSARPCDPGRCCISVRPDDLCTDFPVTFNLCQFRDSVYLSAAKFLSVAPVKPEVIYPKNMKSGHPVEINFTQPGNCKLDIDYSCKDEENNVKTLSALELFKKYKCTGNITMENKTYVIEEIGPIDVDTSCDLSSSFLSSSSKTDTSVTLLWNPVTTNCNQTVLEHKLTYECSCTSQDWNRGRTGPQTSPTCTVTGLKAFTSYTCEINALYDKKSVHVQKIYQIRTEAGKPERVKNFMVYQTENNGFHVNWTMLSAGEFKGDNIGYKVVLILKENEKTTEVFNKMINTAHHEFRNLYYSSTYIVTVKAFNGKFHSDATTKTVHTLFNDKALIGFLVLLILLTCVALLVVMYKIYVLKRRDSRNLSDDFPLIPKEEERLLNVEPIQADALLDMYKKKLADEGRLFLAEFQSVPRIFSKYTMKEAKKNCNAIKNRYVDILPYDYNRVQLTTGSGEQGGDYINASFIDGYKEANKYIAAQGPKEETIADFWRMVWEQKSSIIVMVTRCEEGNRPKCAQYWPSVERGAEIFEEFVVKVNSEDQCPDYTIRHLSLTNRDKSSERDVTHIQFLSWPDHGVPGEPHLLLKLRRRVNAFKNLFSGPIVVHCSAGVGRTGTYIGIDAMMEGLEAENRVDIYGYVVRLRRQRCLMVQVEAQYILIHQALLEHNQFGETEISLSELHSSLSTLKEQSAEEEGTLLTEEFERMPRYANWRTYNAGITEENKKKNRSSSVIPYDYNRVLLRLEEEPSRDSRDDDINDDEEEESSDEEEESSKYINASHVDGYWGSRCFIAAQTPLSDTAADFWLMVHQKRVSTVVMLSESKQEDTDCIYWPKEKTTYGDVEVEVTSTEITPVFVSRSINVRHVKRKEGRAVAHFQFLKWAEGELPEKPQELMDMLKEMRSKCGDSKKLRSSPALVHCKDGSARSGLLVALWNLLDSAETEKLVDVFQVVKTLRKERSGMIGSLEQYQFLYDMLEATFPVQNGDVKAPPPSAANSVEIINETKTAASKAGEEESGTTSTDHQEAPPSSKEEPSEDAPGEDTITSPLVTAEV
ncbi:receptor-type tyrosine-protein phosphatase C [Periophthalmus magnuspinnatus]|uniref:receptor-type tyrosine-protein phosphatase C n=1 Tax=Periophthalmus magnuspinnatus TaxID=409849 RepID=UPI00145A3D26|nr:receptor-type tyrosine-protein phosphatase C [Periophthalmus magnuspinnatus]